MGCLDGIRQSACGRTGRVLRRAHPRPCRSGREHLGDIERSAMCSSCVGPLRLSSRTWISQSEPNPSSTRRGCGGGLVLCGEGRHRKVGRSHAWAQTCRRRICSWRAWGSQDTSKPATLVLISCSVTHRRSAGASVLIHTRWRSSRPAYFRQGQVRGPSAARRPRSGHPLRRPGASPDRPGATRRSWAGLQDLGERMAGPAGAWQFGIELVEAAGEDRRDRRAELVAAPDGGGDVGWRDAASSR